ncbi:uncharacterized protein L203_100174 [Cryptococcus depauperatus CBS 7841]|uniref:Right handed beta helix domain-containing protein n=1 Tax=Cryptococcus depauperatus CBS 7841 TaxID=1295531 RepID=A0AAJ8LX97_9TREE
MRLLCLVLLLPAVLTAKSGHSPKCLVSGTEKPINDAFSSGGEGTVVSLCPGSVHRLNSSIVFTSPRQTLTTLGNLKDGERAMLVVEGEELASAIRADCQQCSFAVIRSLIIDGNRPQLLRVPKGDALVEIGNAESQTVRDCRLYEPRGWSALHYREGDMKQCKSGHVADNEIGPCGEEWDDEYDGMDEVNPLWGNPRADGISLACKDSIVERNIVYDTTDGAIVLFGSANSKVKHNHIYSRTRVVLGGINLVDYEPWGGDYTGVSVHHNHLHAVGRYFKVGIVIGPASWSDDTESVVHSASVTDNSFSGGYWGYGIVVSSARDFTVLKNKIVWDGQEGEAKFGGVLGSRCPKAPENGKPTAFLINRGSAKGTFQEDMINGEVQHIICLNPDDRPYKPWRFRDSSAAISANQEKSPHYETTFDSRIAEALVSYQMSLLSSINSVTSKLDLLSDPSSHLERINAEQIDGKKETNGNRDIDALSTKIEELERGERRLKKTLDGLKIDFEVLSGQLKNNVDESKPVIEKIFLYGQTFLLGITPLSSSQQKILNRSLGGYSFLEFFGALLGVGTIGMTGIGLMQRWKRRIKSTKVY